MSTELQRLTLRLSDDAMAQLKGLADKKGVTVTEAIRQAIGTEIFLSEAR